MTKRAEDIRGMFGRIAPRYDFLNRVLSLGRDVSWRRLVAERVAAVGPSTVLDVCTGTGDLALSFPKGVTYGSDFCLPMLELAKLKASDRGQGLPLFSADALRLPVKDNSVDVVTVGFGVRNFEDLTRGLSELLRVLRNGGTLLVLEFSHPRGRFAPILGWWVRTVPPRIGRLVSGDPEAYTYLPSSVDTFPDAPKMCTVLEETGFEEVVARPLTGGVASLFEGKKKQFEK